MKLNIVKGKEVWTEEIYGLKCKMVKREDGYYNLSFKNTLCLNKEGLCKVTDSNFKGRKIFYTHRCMNPELPLCSMSDVLAMGNQNDNLNKHYEHGSFYTIVAVPSAHFGSFDLLLFSFCTISASHRLVAMHEVYIKNAGDFWNNEFWIAVNLYHDTEDYFNKSQPNPFYCVFAYGNKDKESEVIKLRLIPTVYTTNDPPEIAPQSGTKRIFNVKKVSFISVI